MHGRFATALRVVVTAAVLLTGTAVAPSPAGAGGKPGKILNSTLTTFSASGGLQAEVTINRAHKDLNVQICFAENFPPLDSRGAPVRGYCRIPSTIPAGSSTRPTGLVSGTDLATLGFAAGDTVYVSTRTLTVGYRLLSFYNFGAQTLPA